MSEQSIKRQLQERAKSSLTKLEQASEALSRLEASGFRDRNLRLRLERQRARLKQLIGSLS